MHDHAAGVAREPERLRVQTTTKRPTADEREASAQIMREPTNPVYNFSGQVALVTGAGSGVGMAAATAFAESGASVAVADVNGEAAQEVADRLTAAGHKVLGITCDVSNESQVAEMVAKTISSLGGLDMAFNNAGISGYSGEVPDQPIETFDHITAVNLRGVWACMKHELLHMRAQGRGTIVNTSSIAGLVGSGKRASYFATKHGVVGLTKSTALDYALHGIRINAVCPGVIDTPMVARLLENEEEEGILKQFLTEQPIGRLGLPEEVAAAVLWLSSPASSFILGVALPVDGGYVAH